MSRGLHVLRLIFRRGDSGEGVRLARYAGERLIGLVVVLWLVASLVFLLLRVVPGDPVRILAGINVVDQATVERLRAELGLDQPIVVQYFSWLGHLLQGDLGTSIRSNLPVSQLIGEALPVTVELAFLAILVGVGLSIPLGVAAARRRGRPSDLGIVSLALIGISMPSFVLALLAIYTFSVKLNLLPTGGYVPLTEHPLENLKLMIMPACTLGLVTAGILTRMMRRNLIDELEEDYIVTARAKGAGERRVFYRHALRNAMIPYVTVAGVEVGILLSGAVIVETIFAIPGMGRLMITNINDRDYPVVQGVVFVVAVFYVAVNFVVDLLYVWLDPRVSLR
jgi:peptide/nickel transport system permease protein